MTAEALTVGPGTRVRMDYRVVLEDGSLAEDSGAAPLSFDFGDEALPEALQRCLLGMRAGESGSFEFAPYEAWGPPDPALRQDLPLSDFAPDQPPRVGQIIEFTLPDGRGLAGTILAVDLEQVEVDFNHPLHDRNLRVDVRIIAVEAAQ